MVPEKFSHVALASLWATPTLINNLTDANDACSRTTATEYYSWIATLMNNMTDWKNLNCDIQSVDRVLLSKKAR